MFFAMAAADTKWEPTSNTASEGPQLEAGSESQSDVVDNRDDEKTDAFDGPVEAAAEAEAQPTGPPAHAMGPPPPNGGTKAWLQVLGSWMLFFNTW